MKKLFALLLVGAVHWANAQGYTELNKLLHRLEQEQKINRETELHYDLNGKKFLFLKDFPEKTERKILEINENEIRLIDLVDDKGTNKTASQIYTGDVMRKDFVVSVRADKLEGQKLRMPLTYLYHLTFKGGIWYLIDANTGDRWIDTNDLNKKPIEEKLSKKEQRKLEKLQKRQNKNRE